MLLLVSYRNRQTVFFKNVPQHYQKYQIIVKSLKYISDRNVKIIIRVHPYHETMITFMFFIIALHTIVNPMHLLKF